jgi:hypothetical protein
MPVTFLSSGYDLSNPSRESWATAHPSIGLARYGVRSPSHWKVTAVAGADRTVSILAGQGYGYGITDYTYDAETIQLDPVMSGARWDLIVCRRNWIPAAGESSFQKVNGGPNPTIPFRSTGAGNIDDQPLALVKVTANEPLEIIDLRTWSGDGGGIIANHELVKSFLNATGTRLNINGVDWIRRLDADGSPEWVNLGLVGEIALWGVGGSIVGGAPAVGSAFFPQVGSQVKTTDAQGYSNIVFPKPFPNGLLYVNVSNGDSSVDRAYGRGALNFAPSGQPYDNGTKAQVTYSVDYGTGMATNLTHRVNWVAIGW